MPAPCDPSPYATIARQLRDIRDNATPPTPADIAAKRIRDRHTLARHIASQRASADALAARDARVSASVAERFTDTHNDYAVSPYGPRFNGSTTR